MSCALSVSVERLLFWSTNCWYDTLSTLLFVIVSNCCSIGRMKLSSSDTISTLLCLSIVPSGTDAPTPSELPPVIDAPALACQSVDIDALLVWRGLRLDRRCGDQFAPSAVDLVKCASSVVCDNGGGGHVGGGGGVPDLHGGVDELLGVLPNIPGSCAAA